MKKKLITILCMSVMTIFSDHLHTPLSGNECQQQSCAARKSFGHCLMGGITTIVKDAVELNTNLISLDSVKVLVGFTPFYIGSRFIDERVQKRFYDPECHRNINQIPSTFCTIVEEGAFGIVVGLSSLAFLGNSYESRTVGRIYGIGAVSALLGKKIVKEFKFKGGKRPWHENYSNKNRSDGGFPSGHMVEAAYSATVFGWQYGAKAGIPLGLYAGLMFGVSVNRNRHYVSQVVAGTAVGIMYGLAANRLIDERLCCDLSFDVYARQQGGTEVALSFKF